MTFEEYKDNYLKRWQKRMVNYYLIIFTVHTLATTLLNVSFLFSNTFETNVFLHHMLFRTFLPFFLQAVVLGISIIYLRNPDKSTRNKSRVTVFNFFWLMTVMAFVQSKYSLFMVLPSISMFLAAVLTEKRMLKIILISSIALIPLMIMTWGLAYTKEFNSYMLVAAVSLLCITILVYYISKEILRAQNSHIEFMRHNYNRQAALSEELQIEPLTRLYNRLALSNSIEKLHYLMNDVNYNLEISPVALIFFDLDNFKEVNDKFGHSMGDSILISLGNSIINIMGTNRNAFRYGGDEFILIIRDKNLNETIATVERIMNDFALISAEMLSNNLQCTMSIGISFYKKGQSVTEWVKSADNAAYKAKQNGKNRYEIAE